MIDRISFDEIFMNTAALYSKRSTCLRANVGVVITVENRIVSGGYTGAPSGLPHCSKEICNIKKGCKNTIHAEMNAIAWAAQIGTSLKNGVLYTTLSPCLECAKIIIATKIKRVVYYKKYRKMDGLKLLKTAGILVDIYNKFTL